MISAHSELDNKIMLEQAQGVKQFLTFIMADEEYGVDILTVQEIRSWEEITEIPNAPDYVKGVINLRGTIVPILDLRLRFGLATIDYGPLTVVIVVKVIFEQNSKIMGMVVDAVSDVYSIVEQDAKTVPNFSGSENAEFIAGLVNVGEKMVALLDLQKTMDI
ncbi:MULTISPECIES: chemotaxis protein CheW [Pseudoalteromonas]|jgi:purine-binding chemotaxis protein CheW|uniref:Chemotaxis protein CheW n=1 Tax=Pseudoalteromonas neustonica TaxID=1840331 RepID=A0ABY3FCX5_9GAMM|nr:MULTISPECIES: chemotaxis protein CheW [Pseudoalteromonas]MBB1292804.1 purine-binding chemotaxis protein CheW [Pseudoalteromonas sp. SR41-4]MBB1301938.1 purine-binding chemotaxis protein CheW [Pseudoalteromonas sp. SR44-8]MBB1310201.1 purine-binding chemotaxis protein CheW [Pseudoalteromonas sp. SR41-8]MBB1398934.1 purine-binding chemotaxis protein CheW [Pseudoalteromonas sp. SG44-8]MBB1410023.1 purine-binding chemotaxis protein CheW [Pseudoalteromonas sp. SG44-17]|tara:strand:+ start:32556 stop:33041 length:486 start_codon:yes stop_codon:yes gene_type:complete